MRRVSNVVGRGVVALSVVLLLAGSAQAAPSREGVGIGREPNPIVKVIKKLVVRIFGDGLIDPWPHH